MVTERPVTLPDKRMLKIGIEPVHREDAMLPPLRDGRRNNGGKRYPAGGRPRWSPDERRRRAIYEAARRGLPQDLIAQLAGISEATLKRRCAEELHLGATIANLQIAIAAYEMAVSGDHPTMTRWWLQVRAGWKRA
jgi:hypothetical protein